MTGRSVDGFRAARHMLDGRRAMLVADIIKSKGNAVVTAPPSLPIAEALRLLAEKRIGSILILDRDSVAGILSERDKIGRASCRGRVGQDVSHSVGAVSLKKKKKKT